MAAHATTRRRLAPSLLAALTAGVLGLGVSALPASADPWPAAPSGGLSAAKVAATAINAAVTPSSPASKIRALQWLLTQHSFTTAADGVYGAGTTAHVKAFQTQAGLTADGQAGPNTLGALVVLTQQGQSGANVRSVQELLSGAGHSVGVDGEFGGGTATAVRSFQASAGLGQDGVVGPQTWAALFTAAAGGGGGGGDCNAVSGGQPIAQTALATNGIRVHTCFLSRTNAMVAAAAADGVTLRANSAWRSRDEQIALRRQNCGTTDYDIYTKPSGQCSPPTAIPGTSNHETGLAVDFANAGVGGAVNNWLRANAAGYHYANLPSESWHWSWNGR